MFGILLSFWNFGILEFLEFVNPTNGFATKNTYNLIYHTHRFLKKNFIKNLPDGG